MKKRVFIKLICLCLLSCVLLAGCGKDEYVPYRGSSGGGAKPAFKDESTTGNNTNTNHSKRVAITFDDGPHTARTVEIVDELAKYGYHATFFVVGNRVDGSEYNGAEAMKYAHSKGNEIGIHGYTHGVYYDTCTEKEYKDEISKTEAAIKAEIPNAIIRVMRPIGGRITDARASSSKYSVIMWSVDTEDWKYKNDDPQVIVDNAMAQVKDGGIILMHDIYGNTLEATKLLLKELNEQGYDVVTVSELLGSSMKAGQKYICKG